MIRSLAAVVVAFLFALPLHASAGNLNPQNTLYMDVSSGRVIIKLRPDLAPNHVQRIKELTRAGFYDGTPFHRVIPGFMAQGGDPTGTGMGNSDKPNLKAEFTNTNFVRGTIGAARGDNPNSANSQFFICFQDCSFLNGQYTVWGEVVSGMEFVDKLKAGDPNVNDGQVKNPDKIIRMQVAAEAMGK